MSSLIPVPDPLGLPVPPAILLLLKMFGLFLHMLFMNLWLIGLPLAILLAKKHEKTASRLFHAMPFVMAFGINAGIVPLLFLQTLYPGFFYSATILQAWAWLLIIPCVLLAYYAVYLAAFGIYRKIAAIVASLLLAWVGMTFSASLAFMERPSAWNEAFHSMADSGIVYGLYLYCSADLFLRLGMIIGMALGTVAAFLAFDAFAWRQDEMYQQETRRFIPLLYLLGLAVYGGCGLSYSANVQGTGLLPQPIFWATALSMPIATMAVVALSVRPLRCLAWLVALLHLGVIALNVISRQLVQDERLASYVKLNDLAVRGEWGSLLQFLVIFIAALVTIGWIVKAILSIRGEQQSV